MAAVAPQTQLESTCGSLAARIRRLGRRYETIRYLVSSSLKAGHRDKVLGNLWNLLDPALFMGVYYVIFGILLGQVQDDKHGSFLLHLIVGVLGWRFFDATVSEGTNCVRSNRGLIHEIAFPKAIFPIAVVFARLYDFLWGLCVLFAVLLIARVELSIHILWTPLIVILQVMFTMGMSFIVAYLGAFFADTANVVSVGMRLMFYSSPIFYFVDKRVPEWFRPYYMLNPLACFLESYRAALVRATMPDPTLLAYAAGIALITLIVGFGLFSRGEGRFAKYV